MVHFVIKNIKGHEYLYLVHSVRIGDKVVQKTIKYIGPKRHISRDEFLCMKDSYENNDWILNGFKDELSYKDHEKLNKLTKSYKKYIESFDKISYENEKKKCLSKIISNSNAIEGSTMNIKDTYNYLFEDVIPKKTTKKELNMASNLIKAWNYVSLNKNRFPKIEDLLILHKLINQDIEDDRTLGKFKKIQNYVGDSSTTSFLFVEDKMIKLFEWIKKAFYKMDDFEVIFQSHVQFEIIHPFIDGNGRVGRLLINWLLMYKNKLPLIIQNKNRSEYLSAINNSRRGKIEAISKFCFKEYINEYEDLSE
jgi:Fic family protein